ncbi:MAG: ribosome-associated translation inhibitor RaiA [Anaerolineae bacterium]|nr:ribosome-associated translation inhibitor RaiA [Anaerolineae bacterium]
MELSIKGKNVEVTDRLNDYVEQKIGKLDRYLPTISEVWVELSTEGARAAQDRQVCQVTVRANGTILRAEERSDDMFTSIDAVLDKMYRQIARYKGKRKNRWRGAALPIEPLPLEVEEELEESLDEEDSRIVRTKRFRMAPMSSEEAVEQMELLGHDFFVFYDADEGQINVLYRRKDGDYGLLQPELQ